MSRPFLLLVAAARAARISTWSDAACTTLVASAPFYEDRCTTALSGSAAATITCSNASAPAQYIEFVADLANGETCPFPYALSDASAVYRVVDFPPDACVAQDDGTFLSLNTSASPCTAGDAAILNVGGCTGAFYSIEAGGACVPSSPLWEDASATTATASLSDDGSLATVSAFDSDPTCAATPACVFANVTLDGTCGASQPSCGGLRALQPISITLAPVFPPAATPAPAPAGSAFPNTPVIIGGVCGIVALGLLAVASQR